MILSRYISASLLFVFLFTFSFRSEEANAAFFFPKTVQQLIDAIETANTNNQPDLIILKRGHVYTITGTEAGFPFVGSFSDNGLPVIADDGVGNGIFIAGRGAVIQRDPASFPDPDDPCSGGTTFRFFEVSSGAELTLHRLTLQNGCDSITGGTNPGGGGAIRNEGSLNVFRSVIFNNKALASGGGIINTGDLAVKGSLISANKASGEGGGMNNQDNATAVIERSTVSDSEAVFGAGIHNQGELLKITHSTIVDNTAFFGGSGLQMRGGALEITNTTISGNNFTGGFIGGAILMILDSIADITNVTITENESPFGAGIVVTDTSTLNLKNTLIAANTANTDNNCRRTGGSTVINDLGGNLTDDNTDECSFAFDADFNAATMLGPLQNNGGPTDTHALISDPDNNAIDGVLDCTDQDGNTVIFDQRFRIRPFFKPGGCDIGAYELKKRYK